MYVTFLDGLYEVFSLITLVADGPVQKEELKSRVELNQVYWASYTILINYEK